MPNNSTQIASFTSSIATHSAEAQAEQQAHDNGSRRRADQAFGEADVASITFSDD
jgi:hypothetical protein